MATSNFYILVKTTHRTRNILNDFFYNSKSNHLGKVLFVQLLLFGVLCYKAENELPINFFTFPIGYPRSVCTAIFLLANTNAYNTLLSAALAGVTIDEPIDGKDIWPALSHNLNSPRNDVLCHLDDTDGYQSYINGDYKYVNGTTYDGIYDHWMDYVSKSEKHPSFDNYGESVMNSSVGQVLAKYSLSNLNALAIEKHRQGSIITCNNVPIPTDRQFQCYPLESPSLFNIVDDPCERRNIALLRPVTLRMMEDEVNKLRLKSQPIRNKPSDERSHPEYFDNTWTWWFDELGISDYEENDASVMVTVTCKSILVSGAALVVLSSNVFRLLRIL